MTPENLELMKTAYLHLLATPNFCKRGTVEGQKLLAGLRDAITDEMGMDSMTVQEAFEMEAVKLQTS